MYTEVWQTWSLIEPCENATEDVRGDKFETVDFRKKVQLWRVSKRVSVSELAQQLECAPQLFAAFERGDEILPSDVQRKLARFMKT